MRESRGEVTLLLQRAGGGDQRAMDELFTLVYDELRSQAGRYLRRERSDHTLQATALVHEAYIRLLGSDGVRWNDRAHFYRTAARAMRRLLVEHARRHRSEKRGGVLQRVTLSHVDRESGDGNLDLVTLDEALERLAEVDARKSRVVELRYFAGLTTRQIAEVLDVSPRCVDRDWSTARAWLYRELHQ